VVRGSNVGRVVVLLLAGAAAAAVSNFAAPTERKLTWVGSYPRALEVEPAAGTTPTNAKAAPTTPVAAAAAPPPAAPAPLAADLATAFPPHPDKPSIEIPFADVQRLFENKALFLDARRSSVYADGHIAGARSIPVWESDIDARVKALFEEGLDQRAPIVAYCSGGNCEDSHMLAEKLYMVGFDNVLIYKDGFPDWQKRGLPVARGTSP
jgi:rhodanese-related sulfurtransferase